MRMPSHSEGPGIWLSVWRFLFTHCLYERAAKLLARLRGCAGSPEPSLLAYAISTKFACTVQMHITQFGWLTRKLFVCLCCGLTSQSTIFQSCRDGATASWVINQYFRGVKCLAQGHNTAAVGFEPPTSRSGVRHSTTEPPRSPNMEIGLDLKSSIIWRLSCYRYQRTVWHLLSVLIQGVSKKFLH